MAGPPHLRLVSRETAPARPQNGLARFLRSVGYAWEGVRYIARTQPNWRIHVAAATLVWCAALLLQLSPLELAVLALTVGGVLALEAVNTAIEAAIDAVGEHPSAMGKRAKDAAAGAVLLAAGASVIVGAAIFVPRIAVLVAR